jgi:teichuronic acid biosynthesis glycosyltransferase TuaH
VKNEIPQDWTNVVVIVAGTSWDGIWFPERHIAHHLSQHIPVLWVDPPVSWLTRRNRAPGSARPSVRASLTLVAPSIARLSPVTVPGLSRPVLRSVSAWQYRRAIKRWVRKLNVGTQAMIVASLSEVFDAVPVTRKILYGTDDFVAGAALMGMDRDWLEHLEGRQLAGADIVVAVSTVLEDRWTKMGADVVLVPNGCEASHFADVDAAPLPSDVRLPRPIVGFVGHMSERIDVSLLEAVAGTGTSLLLVGPRQPTFEIERMARLLSRPNVQWVGEKPFAELPSYLRVIDVGLTPYGDTAFNRASFPLKTLEYLAAGRAAVVTALPSAVWLDTGLIDVASTPEDFAAAAVEAAARPGSEDVKRERQEFAARHTWASRAESIAGLIGVDIPVTVGLVEPVRGHVAGLAPRSSDSNGDAA